MQFKTINEPRNFHLIENLNSKNDILICHEQFELSSIDINFLNQASDFHIISTCNYLVFNRLSSVFLNWFFLTPDNIESSNSWKSSSAFFFIRQGIIGKIGGFNRSFKNIDSAYAELTFRCVQSGGQILMKKLSLPISETYKHSIHDDWIFLNSHGNLLSKIMFSFQYPFAIKHLISEIISSKKTIKFNPSQSIIPLNLALNKKINSFSAIIPTYKRYDYLNNAIQSLINCTNPPNEIIVVDQTPTSSRILSYYDSYCKDLVKVFYLDKPGQATARNFAISKCTNEWILFFDDDSVAWPNMTLEHIFLLEHTNANVSTGISLAPWKDISYINPTLSFYQMANVLDTGNAMINKNVLKKVNFLDVAFDKGSGVDDNLGRRLFLNGFLILLNPKAIRTHYKAPLGGLREHGSWWVGKTSWNKELPIATHTYTIISFYPKRYQVPLALLSVLKSLKRNSSLDKLIIFLLFPYKFYLSFRKAKKLKNQEF